MEVDTNNGGVVVIPKKSTAKPPEISAKSVTENGLSEHIIASVKSYENSEKEKNGIVNPRPGNSDEKCNGSDTKEEVNTPSQKRPLEQEDDCVINGEVPLDLPLKMAKIDDEPSQDCDKTIPNGSIENSDSGISLSEKLTVDSKQENSVKNNIQISDNIFEKLNQNISSDSAVSLNDNSVSNESPSNGSPKNPLSLGLKLKESFKGLIKAAASKVGTNSLSSNSSTSEKSEHESLAEQCKDITSTSKMEIITRKSQSTDLSDKGNLFENFAAKVDDIRIPVHEKEVSDNKENDKDDDSDKMLLEGNGDPTTGESDFNDIDDSILDKTEDDINKDIGNENIKSSQENDRDGKDSSEESKVIGEPDLSNVSEDKKSEEEPIVEPSISKTEESEDKNESSSRDIQENSDIVSLENKENIGSNNCLNQDSLSLPKDPEISDVTQKDEDELVNPVDDRSVEEKENNIPSERNEPSPEDNKQESVQSVINIDISDDVNNPEVSKDKPIENGECFNGDVSDRVEYVDGKLSEVNDECKNLMEQKSDVKLEETKCITKLEESVTLVENKGIDEMKKEETKLENEMKPKTETAKVEETNLQIKKDIDDTKPKSEIIETIEILDSPLRGAVNENDGSDSKGDISDSSDVCTKKDPSDSTVKCIDESANNEPMESSKTAKTEEDVNKLDESVKIISDSNSEQIKFDSTDNELMDTSVKETNTSESENVTDSKKTSESISEENETKINTNEVTINSDSRKRLAGSPPVEDGSSKKSRLENMVGGLASRLGKEVTDLIDLKDDNDSKDTTEAESSSSGSESESDHSRISITAKEINGIVKKRMEVYINAHHRTVIADMQKRIDKLHAETEKWKNTAKELSKQIIEITDMPRTERRRHLSRIVTRNMSIQVDENKIQAAAQGLTSGKTPNGIAPGQTLLIQGNKLVTNGVVTGMSAGTQLKTMSGLSAIAAKATDATSNNTVTAKKQTVREMLDEQRSVQLPKAATIGGTTTVLTSPGKGGGSMIVDLTEDDDPNSPPKTASINKGMVIQQGTQMVRGPIVPATSLPPGIRPGTYLLQSGVRGGTVLQPIVTNQPAGVRQIGNSAVSNATVVLGTQGGPAVLNLQNPPLAAASGQPLRQPGGMVLPQLSSGAQVLVRGQTPGTVRPPPPLQSAPNVNKNTQSKTVARKKTSPLSRRNDNKSPDVMITTVTKPNPARSHPAPLPPQPTSQSTGPGKKLLPPKPTLKISRVAQGIVLSWNMTLNDMLEDITNYQLFAYQEGSAPPTSLLWKKVGDVKALPLPMACTLTQFQEGNKYHFAVRAMDKHQRVGPFSEPSTIHLTTK